MATEGSGDFFVGFLVGSFFGAAVVLLLAPASGEEIREQIRERSIELKDRAEDLGLEATKKAEVARAKGASLLGEQKTRFQEAIEEGKRAAARKKEELLAQIESARPSESSLDLTSQD